MEGSLGGGHRSLSDGLGAPLQTARAMEELQNSLKEILIRLSPLEMRNLRNILLKKVDEFPRMTELQLEMEGDSAAKLAALLAKHYFASAPLVLKRALGQLPRADLLPHWRSELATVGLVTPRKCQKRTYDCVDGELDYYDLSGKRKAFLMCVNKDRPGADQDVEQMTRWLQQCGFEHMLCIDPGKKELLDTLTSFRDGLSEIKDEISCCLVTLMSHGEKGFIKINGDRVSLEAIFEMFNNKNCPALHEKPKIFIIQACRGGKRDSGVETDDEPMDSDDVLEKKRLPTFSDYFIIYPTQEDYVALRHPRNGSVMIQAITEVFQKYGKELHIADFFTRVNNKVVHAEFHLQEEPIKVSLVMESTLTRSVYF